VLRQVRGALRPGQIIVDTTTGDPQKMAAFGADLFARGVGYLDAAISGSSADASRGEIIVMAGGRRETFDACEDLFATLARGWVHLGDWGSGNRMKLVTNLVLGLNRAALAEGLALAGAMGLDAETTLAILAQSAAYSRVMDSKGRKMISGDFTPQARLSQHLKDVRLILAEGDRHGRDLPLSVVHRQLLEKAQSAGFGDLDNSVIIRAFEERARDEE
jgi:3-hydroxyisobutyrate dehydrogenase-like beta-hydroxyacid dehydrogenase